MFLDEQKIEYEAIEVSGSRDDPVRKEIAEKSGVNTVPVLHITKDGGEEWIGDSGAIIDWLKNNG
jgi:glutathione S-transferase